MKNKLRTVHIGDAEWKYAISKEEVRIYAPGTKQIKERIHVALVTRDGVQPSLVKEYIEKNLI